MASLRVDAVHPCSDDEGVHGGCALAAAIGAAEEPGLPTERNASQPSFCRVVCEANASVVEKQREGLPALEHVLDRFDEVVSARPFCRFLVHVELKIVDQRAARYFANSREFLRALPVDRELDRKQRVHTAHHFDAMGRAGFPFYPPLSAAHSPRRRPGHRICAGGDQHAASRMGAGFRSAR
jgi:hypothetical protein